MEKFDIRTAKFLLIIVGICLVFLLVVGNAFKYLPSEDLVSNDTVAKKNEMPINSKKVMESDSEEVSEDEDLVLEENNDVDEIDDEANLDNEEDVSESEVTSLEKTVIDNQKDNFISTLKDARKYKAEKEYASAVNTYQKAISLTNDEEEVAFCYEEISRIYAGQKKYGSALSFAQKSYNLRPNSSREFLMLKLYYKTGNESRALEQVNNLLKKDFIVE